MTTMAGTKKLSGGFGLMIAAMLFLWNPHVNVIDVLPDFIGWLLAALSMTTLAWANDDIAQARRRAWILFGITFAKLAPMVFSLLGEKTLPLLAEPTMVLTYTVCFGAFEAFIGIGVMRSWIETISKIGLLGGSTVALYGSALPKAAKKQQRRDYAERLRRMTVWFFVLRYLASFVPELVYLRNTEYLGNVIYGVVIDIRDYRPYLIVLLSLIAGISGLRYLFRVAKYAVRLRRDAAFQAALETLSEQKQEQMVCRSTLERFRLAFGLMFAGGFFLCFFSFENVNILPDFIGIALLLTAAYLLRSKLETKPHFFAGGIGVGVLAVPYYIVRTWHGIVHHGFWTDNIIDYFMRKDLPLSVERQAETMRLQLIMLALAVVETLLVVWFFRRFLHAVNSLNRLSFDDGHTLYDSMTADMMRSEREKYQKLPKFVFMLFCISVSFEAIRALPLFSFVITIFPLSLVRMAANAVFLWYFHEYLTSVLRMIEYHYTYHSDADTHEIRR